MSEHNSATQEGGIPCTGCSRGVHHGNTMTGDMRLLIELAKTANDATLAISEAAKVQAQVALAQIERRKPVPMGNTNISLESSPDHPTGPKVMSARDALGGYGAMIISERVGSISLEHWEGMGDTQLKRLDEALANIVAKATLKKVSWAETGSIIHRELAAAGFEFKVDGECSSTTSEQDWLDAENTTLPGLVRLKAVGNRYRVKIGSDLWIDEMIRIALRLKELRGG